MSRGDWFRHVEWDVEIQADFDAHLRRARDKVQPLKIQAALLAERHPEVALQLLDRYFESGDTFFLADAYCTQAEARAAIGDISGAAESYTAALTREAEFPNVKTGSFVEYPLLVAQHRLKERYGDALKVLAARELDVAFPIRRFMWHAARSLILAAQGERTQARSEAKMALAEAEQTSSEFRYHQSLGLVGNSYHELREQLRDLTA
jgi:tetratricopeptide (TPR) repeat protein